MAALKTEYSYLYEMFLKPTEVGKAGVFITTGGVLVARTRSKTKVAPVSD